MNPTTNHDQFPSAPGGPGTGKSFAANTDFKTFGKPTKFPLDIHDDWVRIQCGVDGEPNYIFGLDGLEEFYKAGAGIYTRENGVPKDSIEYWREWYTKERNERIKCNVLIGEIKDLIPEVADARREQEFKILKACYSYTITRNNKEYYIEAYKINAQRAIESGGVTKDLTEKYPYIYQIFDNTEDGRKAIESLPLTADEFTRFPSIMRKLIIQSIPLEKKKRTNSIKL